MANTNKRSALRKRSLNVGYLTREGARNIRSNRMMSVASIIVLTSCLMIIGLAVMLFGNIHVALQGVQNQNVIMVYLDDNCTAEEAATAGQDIRMILDVDHVKFVSKEEAYQQQLKSLGENASVMEGLDKNPLPDAYEVTLKSLENYGAVEKQLRGIDNVANVRGNSDLAAQVRQLRRAVSIISIGVIVMLLLVSLFIIANTIRVTMYSRRLEISIMKAVGATNNFIRWPFLVEGGIIGVISAVLAELLVWLIYSLTAHSLGNIFSVLGGTVVHFWSYGGWLLLGFVLVGILAGVVGSAVSMARYLKEEGSVVPNES